MPLQVSINGLSLTLLHLCQYCCALSTPIPPFHGQTHITLDIDLTVGQPGNPNTVVTTVGYACFKLDIAVAPALELS